MPVIQVKIEKIKQRSKALILLYPSFNLFTINPAMSTPNVGEVKHIIEKYNNLF